MSPLIRSAFRTLTISYLCSLALSSPLATNTNLGKRWESWELTLEWTALGDSYASGVGSGQYTGGQRCLRYDQAYPVLMNNDNRFDASTTTKPNLFHNAVCSGSSTDDVQKYQFYEEDTRWKPDVQYGMYSAYLI